MSQCRSIQYLVLMTQCRSIQYLVLMTQCRSIQYLVLMTQCRSEKVSLAARQRTITLKVYVKCPWPVGIATPTSRSTRLNSQHYSYPSTSTTHATPLSLHTAPPSYKGPAWISKRLSDQVSSPPVSKKNQSAAGL